MNELNTLILAQKLLQTKAINVDKNSMNNLSLD